MVFISGVIGGGSEGVTLHGILLGMGAAILYASVVILNKLMKNIDAYDKTVVQFIISAVVLTPFAFTGGIDPSAALRTDSVICILIIGVLHTGVAYALYFGSSSELRAHTVAIYSYIDPIIAIILSAALLGEQIDLFVIIGAVLILSASLFTEIDLPRARNNKRTEE
jgi:drug/metabolite transporter (DMT)-like permease